MNSVETRVDVIHANSSTPELNRSHLQLELARVDVLLRREVRRWRLAGQDPADTFRGLYVSDNEVDSILHRPLCSNWGQMVELPPEDSAAFAEEERQAALQSQAIVETAKCQGVTLRLNRLSSVFGLNRFELDTMLICLAPTLDLRYERVYGYLQDDVTRKRPGLNLVLDLLGEPGPERLSRLRFFADDAPLFKYRLLERTFDSGAGKLFGLNQMLTPDETIVAWLLGSYQPHPDLRGHASLHNPQQSDLNRLLATSAWPHLEPLLGKPAIIIFRGPDEAGQTAAAYHCAAELNRSLLEVDLAGATEPGLSPLQAVMLALRDARLTGAIPYLRGWDACLAASEGQVGPDLLDELCAFSDLAIVAGRKIWQAYGLKRNRPLYWLEFPIPSYTQRLALWHYFVGLGDTTTEQNDQWADKEVEQEEVSPGINPTSAVTTAAHHLSAALPEEPGQLWDLSALAGQFALTSAQIRDAVAAAKDAAAQQRRSLQIQDLFAAARAYSNPNLAALARKIVPRYTWSDIILPADQMAILREIVATVGGRPMVLDEWGVGQKLASSRGITNLFAGPPGTGKTMAAEVIAADLGLDLYKIDLSTVVSKYIGETEKNLEKIFNEAQSSNAILFFDEADAIFGKRSEVKDAHDRYANIEISYLLQRMEAYDGVTILATNLRANLDEAFTRRLQFAVDFPFPEKEDRLRIWQTLFPPEVPRDPDLNFRLLAERFKLAGGNIRNIIVSAAYLASADGGQVTMAHLFHGTRRELQKMGRLIEEDLTAH